MIRLIYDLLRKVKYPFLRFKKKVKIKFSSSVSKDVIFEDNIVIGKICTIRNCKIGRGTYFGDNCIVSNTIIGRYCSIAYGFKVLIGKHPLEHFVSTHPAFFSVLKQAGFTYINEQKFSEIDFIDEKNKVCVKIGSDVWIGTDVKINNGVSIGDGAVIGAGSLVLHDVKPYEIVAGVPAKKIGERFSLNDQKLLLDFEWWNKDEDWIKKNIELFEDINKMKVWINKNGE